jgi:hypothetical protein
VGQSEPGRTQDATGRGIMSWVPPPCPVAVGEAASSGAQVSGVESQLRLFLPAPGGEAQTSPVSWCWLRGRLFRASSEGLKWKWPELPEQCLGGDSAQLGWQ